MLTCLISKQLACIGCQSVNVLIWFVAIAIAHSCVGHPGTEGLLGVCCKRVVSYQLCLCPSSTSHTPFSPMSFTCGFHDTSLHEDIVLTENNKGIVLQYIVCYSLIYYNNCLLLCLTSILTVRPRCFPPHKANWRIIHYIVTFLMPIFENWSIFYILVGHIEHSVIVHTSELLCVSPRASFIKCCVETILHLISDVFWNGRKCYSQKTKVPKKTRVRHSCVYKSQMIMKLCAAESPPSKRPYLI